MPIAAVARPARPVPEPSSHPRSPRSAPSLCRPCRYRARTREDSHTRRPVRSARPIADRGCGTGLCESMSRRRCHMLKPPSSAGKTCSSWAQKNSSQRRCTSSDIPRRSGMRGRGGGGVNDLREEVSLRQVPLLPRTRHEVSKLSIPCTRALAILHRGMLESKSRTFTRRGNLILVGSYFSWRVPGVGLGLLPRLPPPTCARPVSDVGLGPSCYPASLL
jgi:hypothetical protein